MPAEKTNISKTACFMDKVIKKSEEVVGITEEHEKIDLDFSLSKNDSSNLTIRLIQ